MSPAGTTRPFTPSRTTSATPPTAVAITGVPTASASTTVCGKFSQEDVSSDASAARKRARTPSRSSGPRKRTRPSSPRTDVSRCASARSGPSPAIRNETSSTRATASRATSSAFCRVIRPANASVGPSMPNLSRAASRSGSAGSGGAAFGMTVTRSSSTPHAIASDARYALGQTRASTRRSVRSRACRRTRTRAPPPNCWKASRSPSNSPMRRARSYASSATSLATTGRRASDAPSEARPSMLVAYTTSACAARSRTTLSTRACRTPLGWARLTHRTW